MKKLETQAKNKKKTLVREEESRGEGEKVFGEAKVFKVYFFLSIV